MVSQFVITQSVRDAAFCLDWLSGPEIGDPYNAPVFAKNSWFDSLQQPLESLKIAYCLEPPFGHTVDPECQNAVQKAIKHLESEGHQIQPAWPEFDMEPMMDALKVIVSANAAWTITARERQLKRKALPNELEKPTWLMVGWPTLYFRAVCRSAFSNALPKSKNCLFL